MTLRDWSDRNASLAEKRAPRREAVLIGAILFISIAIGLLA